MRTQTPSQTVGPFFHDGLILGGEQLLVDLEVPGEWIVISGQVFDGDDQPVPDALIEIWQADAQGFYRHPADPNHTQADKTFRGFGRRATVQEGRFSFLTVKPGRVVGADSQLQAPHINLRVFARGMLIHAVTRIYFADEPSNAQDAVLGLIDDLERRNTLIAKRNRDGQCTYRFDIHLQGERETVFFDV